MRELEARLKLVRDLTEIIREAPDGVHLVRRTLEKKVEFEDFKKTYKINWPKKYIKTDN